MSPAIQVPTWPLYDDPPTPTAFSSYGADLSSYVIGDATLTSLRRFLPSNDASNITDDDPDSAVDAYSCDEFRIYEFKVRRCPRGRSHDWTECPYAHPGEKARRRDPRKYHYSGTACPDFRKGNCKRGDACEFAHGVFECWLHPVRYRTQPCKDGVNCRRKVCFFAHTPEQLRVLPQHNSPTRGNSGGGSGSGLSDCYDGSPLRQQTSSVHVGPSLDSYLMSNALLSSSPTSTLMSPPTSPPPESPPLSPSEGVYGSPSMNELLMSMRQLNLSKAVSRSWGISGSPPSIAGCSLRYGGFNTPTRLGVLGNGGGGLFEWEEPMEWVQSGKDLRAKMAEKISKVRSLNTTDDDVSGSVTPDVDWVSDLVR